MTDNNVASATGAKAATKRPRKMASPPQPAASPIVIPAHEPIVATAPPTKAAQVITLLQRDEGAALNEICQATNWQPHTSRAFLTGLRKKGRMIVRSKREDGTTMYRMPTAQGNA
jgi:Protein of unknown function (DUF3489)